MRLVKGISIIRAIIVSVMFNHKLSSCEEYFGDGGVHVPLMLHQHHRSEILYNLAELYATNLTINLNCENDLKHIIDGVKNDEIWALKCKLNECNRNKMYSNKINNNI